MKLIALGLLLVLVAATRAGQLPWMGVSLDWPDHSPSVGEYPLPDGVGLEVSEVIVGGPLDQAGGEIGDIWWKLDGQILINKRQMLVLLRSREPGDQAKVEYYRGGRLGELTLTLGVRDAKPTIPVSIRPKKREEARVLAKREKVARVVVNGSTLSLKAEGDRWRFEIAEDDTVVLSALVSDRDLAEKVPSKWHQSFLVLRLSLGEDAPPVPGEEEAKKTRYLPRSPSSDESD